VENKYFPYLVGLSAFLIAGSAAFFSVFGISKLFSGAALAVIIMAGSLEIGKLVGASFLYRYWNKISLWLKIYMTVGVITLVGITSAGIFGFLSNAYQGATIEFEKESTKLLYKEDRLTQLEEDKQYLKDELEFAISELPDNYITAKRKLREDYNPKVLEMNDQILDVKSEIGDLKTALIETGIDVGPAIYLARAFGTDVDSVVKFFIFILIFVFDPMAVALVISYNIAMVNRQSFQEDRSEDRPVKKKKPRRLGLYKEGKSLMEKIVKETFSPDDDDGEVKKEDEVIKEVIEDEEEKIAPAGVAGARGSIIFPNANVNSGKK